jgi:thiamine-phosphate pyrophosphorylase
VRRYAITDRSLYSGTNSDLRDALVRQTALWAAEGIDYIQLREKDLPAFTLIELARKILDVIRDTPARLLINSRLDIAVAAAAHGVHLTSAPGQLTAAQVRELYASANLPRPVVSISCHTLPEVEQARRNADIILFAPVFQKTVGGQFVAPGQGLETLRAVCRAAAPTPIYALGGVTLEDAPACLEAGAAGVAGIRLFHS